MRIAVVRVNVDPAGQLTSAQLRQGMTTLLEVAGNIGAEPVVRDLAAMPVLRREVQLLVPGDDAKVVRDSAVQLCAEVFQTAPVAGVVTYVSRGSDDDARGVLSGFGLRGEISRQPDDNGYDVVYVRLRESDLQRVPESRIHTALEASLNCEVRIVTT